MGTADTRFHPTERYTTCSRCANRMWASLDGRSRGSRPKPRSEATTLSSRVFTADNTQPGYGSSTDRTGVRCSEWRVWVRLNMASASATGWPAPERCIRSLASCRSYTGWQATGGRLCGQNRLTVRISCHAYSAADRLDTLVSRRQHANALSKVLANYSAFQGFAQSKWDD
jgi:hypothetical protein